MSIYQTLAEKTSRFQKQKEKDFSRFIDHSITLVKGIHGPEKLNQEQYARMQNEIERLNQVKPGDESLDSFLADDEAYQQQMEWVSLDFSASTRADRLARLGKNQQQRLDASEKYLSKNSLTKEDI